MNNPPDTQESRARIMARLRAASRNSAPARPAWTPTAIAPADRAARFTAMLEAQHAEVYETSAADWPERLLSILGNKGVARVLYAPATEAGQTLAQSWSGRAHAPTLVPYDRRAEEMKAELVHGIGAGLTTTLGGIAETGSLVLRPSVEEPRLMSLLPPVHVALVYEDHLAANLADMMMAGNWAADMPTNMVLVSGPSKTADIEQTLAYGVHGPKELVVLLIKSEESHA